MSSKSDEVRRQIEFYFSDSNFPYDKFLWNLADKNDGWVPLQVVNGFRRLKKYGNSVEQLKEILLNSSIVELDEKQECVRRKEPLKLSQDENQRPVNRTAYIKGFPVQERAEYQIFLEKFLQNVAGDLKINSIRMRREDDKTFKGSVYIEFDSVNDLNDFCSKKLEFEGNKLLIKTKLAFLTEKALEYKDAGARKGKRNFNAYRELKKRAGNTQNKAGSFVNKAGTKRKSTKALQKSSPKKLNIQDSETLSNTKEQKEVLQNNN